MKIRSYITNTVLKDRNGIYYVIITYKDKHGEFQKKWISSGLPVKNNKRKAQEFLVKETINFAHAEKLLLPDDLQEEQKPKRKYTKKKDEDESQIMSGSKITLVEYISDYVKSKEVNVSPSTYRGYLFILKRICEYFSQKLKLSEVTHIHINRYYEYLKTKHYAKNISVKKHHQIISPALTMAYKSGLIPKNPMDLVMRIKTEAPHHDFYDVEELTNLFKYTDQTPLGLVVRVGAYYGLRRSELLGLHWSSIDFENKIIYVNHKLLKISKEVICSNEMKTEKSNRALPLLPEIENLLLKHKAEVEENQVKMGNSYNHTYDDFIFVNALGDIFTPDYVTHKFAKILKENGLKYIRFHDLRHSCASMMVANHVDMKNIQEWLGHSSYNLTANTYSHLNFDSKRESGKVISNLLSHQTDAEALQQQIANLEKQLEEKKKLLESGEKS